MCKCLYILMGYHADNEGQHPFLPYFLTQGHLLIPQFASVLEGQKTSTWVVDNHHCFYMDALYLSTGPSLSSDSLPKHAEEVFPMVSKYLYWCLHIVPNTGFAVMFVCNVTTSTHTVFTFLSSSFSY